MTTTSPIPPYTRAAQALNRIPSALVLHITDSTYALFETDYKLPFLPPWYAAHAATYSEHFPDPVGARPVQPGWRAGSVRNDRDN